MARAEAGLWRQAQQAQCGTTVHTSFRASPCHTPTSLLHSAAAASGIMAVPSRGMAESLQDCEFVWHLHKL